VAFEKVGNTWIWRKKHIDGFKVSFLVIIPMIINTLLFSEGLKTIGFLYR
jgi:hypothetical protein